MKELSLHLLDLIENSIEAGAKNIFVEINKNKEKTVLRIVDDGRGIPEDILRDITNPFTTTRRTRKVGLGISLFNEVITNCSGKLNIKSKVGEGTELISEFPSNHIDLPPWGNLADTIYALIVTHPEINFNFKITTEKGSFEISTKDIKSKLGGDNSFFDPEVIRFIKSYLNQNLGGIGI